MRRRLMNWFRRCRLRTQRRTAYNKIVKTACKWRDEALMKEQMEPMKDKKLRMMFYQNLDLKEYVKKGTLFSARKPC